MQDCMPSLQVLHCSLDHDATANALEADSEASELSDIARMLCNVASRLEYFDLSSKSHEIAYSVQKGLEDDPSLDAHLRLRPALPNGNNRCRCELCRFQFAIDKVESREDEDANHDDDRWDEDSDAQDASAGEDSGAMED